MSTRDQTSRSPSPSIDVEVDSNVEDELIAAQILQRLERIERTLSSMENRFSGRLEDIECRLAGAKGSHKVVTEKPNVRNMLMSMLLKGWVTETEALEKTGWQTIGVRSFITKQRSNGLSIEEEDRDGVKRWRIKTT